MTGPYSAAQNLKVKVLNDELHRVMVHKLAMLSYDKFMTDFLPAVEGEPDANIYDHMFDAVPTDGKETDMYKPFVRDIPSAFS